MRKFVILLFIGGVDGLTATLFSWQVWAAITVACGGLSIYLYRSELWKVYCALGSQFALSSSATKLLWAVVISSIAFLFVLSYFLMLPAITLQCVRAHFGHINRVVEEKNRQIFEKEIRSLYPKLVQCGLRVPVIDPVRIGYPKYDNTWKGFHVVALKVLRLMIEEGSFELQQWNADFERENAKRRNIARKFKT